MLVENVMYFALGALLASLLALLVMPAIWKRAVRLTTRRIEAATPVSMAEFRADKDQLRAEFALSTRKLEMQVETLRNRISEQVAELAQKRGEFDTLSGERGKHAEIIAEFEQRETGFRDRIRELETELADVSQRLRMQGRDLEQKLIDLDRARQTIAGRLPGATPVDIAAMSGDLEADNAALIAGLAVEKQRAAMLEAIANQLVDGLASIEGRAPEVAKPLQALRRAVGRAEQAETRSPDLIVAEARIASAETQLNAILEETAAAVPEPDLPNLAAELSDQDRLVGLRGRVLGIESDIRDRRETNSDLLRKRLEDIAAEVSRLVYAEAAEEQPVAEESLFDRVQRFSSDGVNVEEFPVRAAVKARQTELQGAESGPITERMAALRDILRRH